MAFDTIALVEAAYRLDADEDSWVRGIASAALPFLDQDQGLVVANFRIENGTRVQLSHIQGVRLEPEFLAHSEALVAQVPPSQIPRAFPAVPFTGWASQVFSKSRAGRKLLELTDMSSDRMGVICPSEPSRGLMLTVVSPETRSGKIPLATWLRLATHLSHAGRLRATLGATLGATRAGLDLGGDGAVFSADGNILHVEGEARSIDARQALRAAARAVDGARSGQRRSDPERALLSWKGLVDGRWSLVDTFDSDGRRFVVARRNEPAFRRPRALSARERHVVALAAVGHASKVVAYQLGISTAAVDATLGRALHKLGLHSRAELATIAGVLTPWEEQPPPPITEDE
jgi:DNA-binding CsgD family transcriptional regulator